jgi:hypothetical protein
MEVIEQVGCVYVCIYGCLVFYNKMDGYFMSLLDALPEESSGNASKSNVESLVSLDDDGDESSERHTSAFL